MPIDIPPDKINLPPARATAAADAVKAVTRPVLDTSTAIKAVVSEVIQHSATKAQNNSYDALLTLNPDRRLLAGQGPLTQINNETAQQIIQGSRVQIRVQTQAPLKIGQQLIVQIQGQALKLLEIAPPDLQTTLKHFIRHEVNQQSSYTSLLSKLMGIAQAIKAQNTLVKSGQPVSQPASMAPKNTNAPVGQGLKTTVDFQSVEKAATRFIESLPQKAEVSTAPGLKAAIRNSGVFYENTIATSEPARQQPAKADSNELIQQIKQQIKTLKAAVSETPNKGNSPESAARTGQKTLAENHQPAPAKAEQPLSGNVRRDLKFNLLNLQKQLEKLEQPGKPAPDKGAALDSRLTSLPRPLSPVYQRPLIATPPTQQGSAVNSSSGAYAISDKEADSAVQGKSSFTKLLIHPPLPGGINVQAQAVRPQTGIKESLADALVSVLIKNTKEAISRLNLHQLSNLTDTARQESATAQTSLSFELPVLSNTGLALFQFRIQEEENDNSNTTDPADLKRKWVVHMGFDLEGLGAMYCQITLVGVSASVTFWAEEKATVNRSQQHLDELRGNLTNLGVTIKDMQCIEGSPPTDQSGIKQTLIDIET
ncbi:MAG: hypothetical protein CSA49_00095 [Gammaproteobacteria bacterium]|nr:MAG: hypothetical protein CSA49_00095 [Gammaproteobacteria bacterium]